MLARQATELLSLKRYQIRRRPPGLVKARVHEGRRAIAERRLHPMRAGVSRGRPRRTLRVLRSPARNVRSAPCRGNALALCGANFCQQALRNPARVRALRDRERKKVRRRSDATVPLCASDGRGHLARRRCCRGTFLGRGCSFGRCSAIFRRLAFRRRRRHVSHDATSPSPTVVCGARRIVLRRRYLECRATATATERFGFPGPSIASRSARAAASHRRSSLAPTIDPVRDRRDADQQQPCTVAGFVERVRPEYSRRRRQIAASLYEFLGAGHAHEQDRVAGRMPTHDAGLSKRALTAPCPHPSHCHDSAAPFFPPPAARHWRGLRASPSTPFFHLPLETARMERQRNDDKGRSFARGLTLARRLTNRRQFPAARLRSGCAIRPRYQVAFFLAI